MGQHTSECVLRGGIGCGDEYWQHTANRLALVTRARRAGPSPAGDGKEGFAIAHLLVWRLCGARLRFAGRFSALRWSRSDARMARWAAPKARQGRICKSLIANFAAFAARGSASLAAFRRGASPQSLASRCRRFARPSGPRFSQLRFAGRGLWRGASSQSFTSRLSARRFARPSGPRFSRPRCAGHGTSARRFVAVTRLALSALRSAFRLTLFGAWPHSFPRAFLRGIHLVLRALRRGHPAGPCALSGARRGFTTDKSRRAGAGNGGDAPCLLF